MARVVFLGTPVAAVPSLHEIARTHELVGVITRPDRPRGRSGRPVPPPVKTAALELGVPVSQPADRDQLAANLADSAPIDAGVVVAFGRILRPEVLEIPSQGMINVHFSLLPRWRGAAPVERALMAGDPMTGVTIIKLDEGLDTGPVLTAQAIDIRSDENGGALTGRLAALGARLVGVALTEYLSGELIPVEQSDVGVTYAEKITTEDRRLDTRDDVSSFVARVKALAPSPGASIDLDGKSHKVLAATPHEAPVPVGTWALADGRPVVGARDGSVELLMIQPPGKRAMEGEAWGRGLRETSGRVG